MTDSFWFFQPSILIDSDRIIEFFPNKNYSNDENLNALVRLSLYISIIFIIYKKDINWISIFIFSLLLSYYVHINTKTIRENFEENIVASDFPVNSEINSTTDISQLPKQKNCSKPDLENPFMNLTMNDLLNTDSSGKIKDKAIACDINDPIIKKSIDSNFKNNLFRDINDVFGKYNSQRQFFTMPWTDIIPDAEGNFKNWLYKQPLTCHEDQDHCIRGNYEDVRSNSFLPEHSMN